MRLQGKCIVSPKGSTLGNLSLLVDPEEEQTPWQNGRVWSFGGCRPSLAQLNRTSPESLCLATRQTGLAFWLPSVAQVFKNASQSLGLRFVPSQGRHFGASMDRATKFRSLGEVKHRGGWKQDKSVARYEKGSRLGFGARQYPTMLTVHGDECEKHLEDIFDPRANNRSCCGRWQSTAASGCHVADVSYGKGGLGRAVELAGFPVRYWDSRFGCKGDIGNPAVLRQLTRDIRTAKPLRVCSRLQLRLSAWCSAVPPLCGVPHSQGRVAM